MTKLRLLLGIEPSDEPVRQPDKKRLENYRTALTEVPVTCLCGTLLSDRADDFGWRRSSRYWSGSWRGRWLICCVA
jgi:hypothetical protein